MKDENILKVIKNFYKNEKSFKYENQNCNLVIPKNELIKNNKKGKYSDKLKSMLEDVSSIVDTNNKIERSIPLNAMEAESSSTFPFYIRRLVYKDTEPKDGKVNRVFSFLGFNNNCILYVAFTTIGSKKDNPFEEVLKKINYSSCFTLKNIGKLQPKKDKLNKLHEKKVSLQINDQKKKYIYHFIIIENDNKVIISEPFSSISQKQLIKREDFIKKRLEQYKDKKENDILYYYNILYDSKIHDFKDELVFELKYYTNEKLNKELNEELSNELDILNSSRNENMVLKDEVPYPSPVMTENSNYSPGMNEVLPFSSPKDNLSFYQNKEMSSLYTNEELNKELNEKISSESNILNYSRNENMVLKDEVPYPSPVMTECSNYSPRMNKVLPFTLPKDNLSIYQNKEMSSFYLEGIEKVNFNNNENEKISEQLNNNDDERYTNSKFLGSVFHNSYVLGYIYLVNNEYYITPYNKMGQTFDKLIIINNYMFLRTTMNEKNEDIFIGEVISDENGNSLLINSIENKRIGETAITNDLFNIYLYDINNQFANYLLFLGNIWYINNELDFILGDIYLINNEYCIKLHSMDWIIGKIIIYNNSMYLRTTINEDIFIGNITEVVDNEGNVFLSGANKNIIIGKYTYKNYTSEIFLWKFDKFVDYLLTLHNQLNNYLNNEERYRME
ncbi:hypothetical protein H8356DRAFT_1622812 [Neocallimastix lanati (nom. inval.)]|nr:hypothetical protein H8356DRAFT_1622812 [Neocallimastix sp. JGI-2020a]